MMSFLQSLSPTLHKSLGYLEGACCKHEPEVNGMLRTGIYEWAKCFLAATGQPVRVCARTHGFWMESTRISDAAELTDFGGVGARGARGWAVILLCVVVAHSVPVAGISAFGASRSSRRLSSRRRRRTRWSACRRQSPPPCHHRTSGERSDRRPHTCLRWKCSVRAQAQWLSASALS